MRKILFLCAAVMALASCEESYKIQGASSVSQLDGSKLYLKVLQDKELVDIDSCEVIHGKFKFAGLLDTTKVVNLFLDEQSLMMPIVLEADGEIKIRIDNSSCKVSGTKLNDELYDFIDKHNQLNNRMNELDHRYSQMLLDAIDEQVINETLSKEAAVIAAEEDSLVTNFIVDNFDNILGPRAFRQMTLYFEYPVLTPQIEDIMSKATDKFKNDPYVSNYYAKANELQNAKMQGLTDERLPSAALPDSTIQNMLDGKQ